MPFQIPDPIRKARLSEIQKWLLQHKEEGGMTPAGKAVNLMLQEPSFQRHVATNEALREPVKDEAGLMRLAWGYLYHLLTTRDMVGAAMMLWDRETFCAEPHQIQTMWRALMEKRMICIMGGGGLGKTYSPTAYFMLEFILDPEWTRLDLASASESHLLGNMFADAIRLHSGASLALPGKQDTESISLDKKRGQGIFTLTLPGGATGKSKIKGKHTKPRAQHPLFGRRSRVFALIDESQEVPPNVFDEIPNRFSTANADDVEHLKFVICANPRDIFSKFAKCAEPKGGWSRITRDDVTWESKTGWTVISLDQTKHENYVQRREVFPGFAKYSGFQTILKSCDGDPEHPRMYTLCYGKFPPQGTLFACIKQQHLLSAEGEWIFSGEVTPLVGSDPAYTSDRPALCTGRAGLAAGWTDAEGVRHMLPKPMMAVQIDAVTVLSHGDSQELADEIMYHLKAMGVKPSGFGIDQTGTGRGTADIIRHQWKQKVGTFGSDQGEMEKATIHGLEYASSPTTAKIAEEDTKGPNEMYDRLATELWYAAAKFFEFGIVRIGKGVDIRVLSELSSRKGDMQPGLGKRLTIETKQAYKQRTGGDSPDLADATLVMLHVARMSIAGITPKAPDTKPEKPTPEPPPWSGFGLSFQGAEMPDMAPETLMGLEKD